MSFMQAAQVPMSPPLPTPKIIDYIIYNGDLITPQRLKYLYDAVDEFVIVEAWYTHTGVRKPHLYKDKYADDFAPYLPKCTFIIIDEFPDVDDKWQKCSWMHDISSASFFRERYQRNAGRQYIIDKYGTVEWDDATGAPVAQGSGSAPQYIIISSDTDEIPNIYLFELLKNNYALFDDPVYLEMLFFYYNFNWIKQFYWYHAFIINANAFAKYDDLFALRIGHKDKFIKNAGWHCSNFMTIAGIREKIESIAHKENDLPQFKTDAHIQNCIRNGVDLFARGKSEDLLHFSEIPRGFEMFQKFLESVQEK